MLYKFKSAHASDVIMLQANGQRILEVIGKDAGPKGIILPEQMPAAIAALEAAIAEEERRSAQAGPDKGLDEADDAAEGARSKSEPGLRQRAAPFIDMLKRNLAAGKEVVWGN